MMATTTASYRIWVIALVVCCASITTSFACEDSAFDFPVDLGDGNIIRKTCKQARKNPWNQCAKPEVSEHCPKTCAVCEGDVRCRIKADLQFPQLEGGFVGFHKQSVQVEKIGEDRVCFAGDRKTNWGCTHVEGDIHGDAIVDARSSTAFEKKSANVRIYDGRDSTFKIGVSHVFSEEEVGQDLNYLGRANLILKVNGKQQSVGNKLAFKHGKNPNKPTHVGYPDLEKKENVGFINPLFNGDFFMTIECDNDCQCTTAKVEEKCEVKLQLKFPNLSEIDSEGQRSEEVTVTNLMTPTELCSPSNNHTSWCRSYSEALVFKDVEFLPLSRAQFIIIPDAADGHFELRFDITNRVKDEPLLEDKYGAELIAYVNGNQQMLTIDPMYTEGAFVDLRCDSACNCETILAIP